MLPPQPCSPTRASLPRSRGSSRRWRSRDRGTSARVCRAILLAEPPSLDIGETTDKGSINQRAVLARRAALVEELYADPPPASVIVAGRSDMAAAQGS